MSITPPTPATYDLLSPTEVGYWLDSTTDDQDPFLLPLTARITTPLGYDRTVSMERPPLSETPFLIGDGRRNTAPVTLQFELPGFTAQQVRAYRTDLESRLSSANILGFGSIRRALLGSGWSTWAISDARHMSWTCSITLYPSTPDGYDTDGSPVPF